MEPRNYDIFGQVINLRDQRGVYNMRVEAWDKDTRYNDLLGVAFTNAEGGFHICFDTSYFREFAPDTEPDIFFKVLMGKRLIKSTEEEPILNAGQKVETVIILDLPPAQPEESQKDRLTTQTVIKASRFYQQSDFNGVYRQYSGKAGNSYGLVTDIISNSVKDFSFNPIRTENTTDEQVLNQDVEEATANLEKKNIEVNEVYTYRPKIDRATLKDYKLISRNLKEGQKVNLYQENGKVRYYSIVDEKSGSTGNEETTKTLEKQKEEMVKMQAELKVNREQMVKKELEIQNLKKELTSIKKDQKGVKDLLSNKKLMDFLKDPNT